MATPLPMPKLGLTMESGTILKWMVGEGDPVKKGEIVLQIQTDKVEYDVEAPDKGSLLKMYAAEGEEIACGENLAVIGEPGEDISGFQEKAEPETARQTAPPAPSPAPAPAAPAPEASTRPASAPGARVFASPAARRIARELGIDYRTLRGSGPNGRIVQADVRAAAGAGNAAIPASPPAAASGQHAVARSTPVTGMRKVIIDRMGTSWSQVPRVTLQIEADLTNLLAVREASKLAWESDLGVKVSINDLILFYTARAVRRCPAVNVTLSDGQIHQMQDVNLGVAVAVEDGLLVPVIRGSDQKSIDQISRESRALAENGRSGTLPLTSLEGGTFTVSNLGAYGIDHFSAIVNMPESAILSVGTARPRAVVRDGEVVPRTTAFFGINADHRLVDGAPAAEFLKTLKEMLEHPKVMPA